MPAKKSTVPDGHVMLRHEDPNAACSEAHAEDGVIVVPHARAAALAAHGFLPLIEKTEDQA